MKTRLWVEAGWLVMAALLSVPGIADAEQATFGLVVGTNRSHDPEVRPLRYADDDAVQNARLISEFGGRVVLLAELDARSRGLYRGVRAMPPTKAAVRQALARLNALMEDERRAGKKPVLYFFYSGHGDVENNEGYVNLQDGRLRRGEFLELLRQSKATFNHVIIDACKSYFLVFARGAGGKRSRIVAPLGDVVGSKERLPKNTGFLLSTSAAVDSHEWEAFQGGIFSHELRSAMRGAADHDLDGKVTYEEAGAFVWSANRAIRNPRFRPKVFARPPSGREAEAAVLMQLSAARGDRLHVGVGNRSHLYVEDEDGLRLADFRPSPSRRLVLVLPTRRPLFVRYADDAREVRLPAGKRIVLSSLSRRKVTSARRGAEHVAFRRLFAEPFDGASITAYRRRPPEVAEIEKRPADLTWLRRGLGIGAAVLAVAGGTMTVLAARENRSVGPETSGVERRDINDRIDGFNIAAVSLYALAGSALAAYLTWTLWPERTIDVQLMPMPDQPRATLSIGF